MTEAGHVSLATRGSQEDVARAELGPGDWIWLTDSEVLVGAQLAIDDRHGLVGVPDWDTLVHLDEEGADDIARLRAALNAFAQGEPQSADYERRVFELLAQLEHFSPPDLSGSTPAALPLRRALALRQMGKLGLALVEIEEARRERPDDPVVLFVQLDLLRLENLPSAVKEAEGIADRPSASALVLAGCINVLASQADQTADDQFEPIAERVLALCRRLDQAPDRDQAGERLLALTEFNRGIVHLRAGRITQAQDAFRRAQLIYRDGPMNGSIAALETYDRHAREVARSVRMIAEQWSPQTPVAA
jgi:tetratricopeptide (TPR) repeat protein